MALRICLLGSLVIENDQRRLGKLPRKARALMAYLATQAGRPISRERLSDLLWPYQGSEQARHSLRNCLLELRKALGENARRYLVGEFANCRLQEVDTDLDSFEQLSRSHDRAELLAAEELYRGEFLADFVIDSEPFQEWLASERDRTLDLICTVLQRLTALQDEAGEHEAAIRSARRLASLDQLSEIGQRALIRAYARAGRRPEALRQYRTCAEILKRELGVAPDAETQALANEIARSGGIVTSTATRPGARPTEDRWPAAGAASTRRDAQLPSLVQESARPQWPCLLPNIAVAVATLRNLTGDPGQQYRMEAFTEDLVTDLLRRGPGLSLARIGDERSVAEKRLSIAGSEIEYIVTGSAQRSGQQSIRVNVQVSESATAEYRWARRYECDPDELGLVQPRITRQVSREVHALLLREASRRAFENAGVELGVNECLAQATGALKGKYRPEVTAEAQRWFLAALALDPKNLEGLIGLARTCQHLVSQPWWGDSNTANVAFDLGREAINDALALAPQHPFANCVKGMLCSAGGQLEEAVEAFDVALTADPRLGIAHAQRGYNAAFLGHAEETMPAIERAMRYDQSDRRHSIFYFFGGFAELLLGRTAAATELLQKSLERNPSYGAAELFMVGALLLLGRKSEAERAATAFREQYPESRANDLEQLWLARSNSPIYRAQVDPIFEKLRAFGIGA